MIPIWKVLALINIQFYFVETARCYECEKRGEDELIFNAFREAEGNILPFRAHFTDDTIMLNYSVAALAALNIGRKNSDLYKLPRNFCPLKQYTCDFKKYRTYDGGCTNFFSPASGSRFSPFSRRVPASYEDGVSSPRLHNNRNYPLPFPEVIEEHFSRVPSVYPQRITKSFLEFADFLYKDMAKFMKLQNELECCATNNPECLKIGENNLNCYKRSAAASLPNCAIGQREQMNLVTAFIDAGPIYQDLKDDINGKLSTNLMGVESNAILNLFTEEHNWILENLQKHFPEMSTATLFEETRVFLISEIQHITIQHFLPILLGEETMDKYELYSASCERGSCHEIDSNTLNEFGTTAGLFYKFMKVEDASFSTKTFADLAELVMKGRDHGIGTYVQWREECGGGTLSNYEQLKGLVDSRVLKLVRNLYPNIRDVDLLILGLAENTVYGSLLGPTFGCILALQFQKAKFGDGYWYSSRLLPAQLAEIEKTSISAMLCRHQKSLEVQRNAFRVPDAFQNIPVSCNSTVFPQIHFANWVQSSLSIPSSKIEKFAEILEECTENVFKARNQNRDNQKLRDGHFNSVALKSYGSMMLAKDEAVLEANISFILLEATKKLVTVNNINLENIQGVSTGDSLEKKIDDRCNPKSYPCDPTDPYRTYTGWCNNLKNPSAANTFRELKRLLPPHYEDGIGIPRTKSSSGNPLPSPRAISNNVHNQRNVEHVKYSHLLMEFGQFIDHDITHSPVDQNPDGTPLNCSRCDSGREVSSSCFPIRVPEDDVFFEPRSCLSFVRSLPAQKKLGYRNQMNQVSAYLDGSVMYGSTKCEGDRLRTFANGKLKATPISQHHGHYGITLPQSDESEQDGCVSSPEFPCFIAGDDRNSQQTLLIAVHTVFHREHERITDILRELNKNWDDERIYQETRKLVSAQFTHIVYNEYLPAIIGENMVDLYDIRPLFEGYYDHYESCDASILQPFATAAFRFGHSTVTRFTPMQKTKSAPAAKVVDLASDFLNMSKIYGGSEEVEKILGGMHSKHQMMTDRFIDDAVRNFLFSDRGKRGTGLDLIAINIQRGRDHGIPSYNHYRAYCGLDQLTSFYSIFSDIDRDGLAAISKVYEAPDDIDLFTGIVAEKTINGGIVGPTAACIIAEQFRRLKKCDRYYYENGRDFTKFSLNQLREIRKTSLSALICANTKTKMIARDVFSVPDSMQNPLIPCDLFRPVNLSHWRDDKNCLYQNKLIEIHSTVIISPCTKCTCTSEGVVCAFMTPDCSAHSREVLIEDPICFMQCAQKMRK